MNFSIDTRSLLYLILILFGLQFLTTKIAEGSISDLAAEDISVSGIVVDADTGDPLAGVNIIVEGSIAGVATCAHGEFTLNYSG